MNYPIKFSLTVALLATAVNPLLSQPTVTELDPWTSQATGTQLARQAILPEGADAGATLPTVIYLQNLAAPRVGTDSDADIIDSFLADGLLVVTVDYAGHGKARVPFLSDDVIGIRADIRDDQSDLTATRFPTGYSMDNNHIYLIPEGCRLLRDLTFATLSGIERGMDVIYPANPVIPTGALIEISYDNINRMNSANLANFDDSLVTAMASEGFATAMADHPVSGQYSGIDPMPQSAVAARAAVAALRAQAQALGLNGRIATAGFSRGSGVALMPVTTTAVTEWWLPSLNRTFSDEALRISWTEFPEPSTDVQGAIILSGRFSYIDLLEDDPNLDDYTAAWGPIETNFDRWEYMGAIDFLEADPGYPLFLSLNTNEDAYANHHMDVLRQRLDGLGADYVYMPDTTDLSNPHRVPAVHAILNGMTEYLRSVLMDPSPAEALAGLAFQAEMLPENRIRWSSTTVLPPLDYNLQSSGSLSAWTPESPVRPDPSGILSIERDLPAGSPDFIRLLPPEPPAE